MSLLSFQKMTPEQIALLKTQVQIHLTPKDKFDRFVKQKYVSSKKKIREFHFVAVEHGTQINLFNGLGQIVHVFPNDFHGQRAARVFAVELFTKTAIEKRNGGYTFDFYPPKSEATI